MLPIRWIEPTMASLTLVGVASSLCWLRIRVLSAPACPSIVTVIALLTVNQFWLLGFQSFLIAVSVAVCAVGLHWLWRDRLTWRRAVILGGLQVITYFCHAVPWGFLVAAYCIHAAFAPGSQRLARFVKTAVCLAPSLVLAVIYWGLASRIDAPAALVTSHPIDLLERVNVVDFITLKSKTALPFVDRHSEWFVAATPLVWMTGAFALLAFERLVTTSHSVLTGYRSWILLARCCSGLRLSTRRGSTRTADTCRHEWRFWEQSPSCRCSPRRSGDSCVLRPERC
jgi:hypothetical protein